VTDTVSGETAPVGVPGFVGPVPPPLLPPPPPQLTPVSNAAKTKAPITKFQRRVLPRAKATASEASSSPMNRTRRTLLFGVHGAIGCVGTKVLAAVLLKVSVAVAVPFAGRVKLESEHVISSVAEVPQDVTWFPATPYDESLTHGWGLLFAGAIRRVRAKFSANKRGKRRALLREECVIVKVKEKRADPVRPLSEGRVNSASSHFVVVWRRVGVRVGVSVRRICAEARS
jgi:hypothetical protein